ARVMRRWGLAGWRIGYQRFCASRASATTSGSASSARRPAPTSSARERLPVGRRSRRRRVAVAGAGSAPRSERSPPAVSATSCRPCRVYGPGSRGTKYTNRPRPDRGGVTRHPPVMPWGSGALPQSFEDAQESGANRGLVVGTTLGFELVAVSDEPLVRLDDHRRVRVRRLP